jgi:hypothetical protein
MDKRLRIILSAASHGVSCWNNNRNVYLQYQNEELIMLTNLAMNPAKQARLSPRLNSGSMKRHPDVPSTNGLDLQTSKHARSVSQPEFSIPEFVASEKELGKSDRTKTVQSDPSTPAAEGNASGAGLTRFLSAKKSIVQIFNTSQRSQSDTALVPSRSHTSIEEATEPSPSNTEYETIEDQLEADIQRAMKESLREEEQRQAQRQDQRQDYVLGPSHGWHNTISEQSELLHSPFDSYPSPSSPSSAIAPRRNHLTEQTDSIDEELQKVLDMSRVDRGPGSMSVPIPTIQVHEQPLQTPPEELQKALEMSRVDY